MPGGVKTDVRTYQMYINGEFVESAGKKMFDVYDPSTEEVLAQVPDAQSEDVNRAVAAAKAAFEEGAVALDHACGARPHPHASDRKDPPEPGDARGNRMPQLGQTDRGSGIRHRRCRDLLRILRRFSEQSGGLCESSARQRAQPFAERASRCCGTDHPLELSAVDGRVETGAGDRGRMYLRPQTCRANTADRAWK